MTPIGVRGVCTMYDFDGISVYGCPFETASVSSDVSNSEQRHQARASRALHSASAWVSLSSARQVFARTSGYRTSSTRQDRHGARLLLAWPYVQARVTS